LTLGKIIKIVATRCQIKKRLKCTKFNFGWGSAQDPAGGAYSAPPDPLAGLMEPTSKGRERDEMRRGREGTGRGAEGRGREGMERGRRGNETPPLHAPPNPYFWIRPCNYFTCHSYDNIHK